MGILRKLAVGSVVGGLGDGGAGVTLSAIFAAPGTDAARSPPVAARSCLRSMSGPLRCFFMRLLDKRSNGMCTNISAALYFTLTDKQAAKIVFLNGFNRIAKGEGETQERRRPGRAAAFWQGPRRIPGRNRESRRREARSMRTRLFAGAAGRRNYPEATPKKMSGRKGRPTRLSTKRQGPGRVSKAERRKICGRVLCLRRYSVRTLKPDE